MLYAAFVTRLRDLQVSKSKEGLIIFSMTYIGTNCSETTIPHRIMQFTPFGYVNVSFYDDNASSIAAATETVAPTIGLLPMPI